MHFKFVRWFNHLFTRPLQMSAFLCTEASFSPPVHAISPNGGARALMLVHSVYKGNILLGASLFICVSFFFFCRNYTTLHNMCAFQQDLTNVHDNKIFLVLLERCLFVNAPEIYTVSTLLQICYAGLFLPLSGMAASFLLETEVHFTI